MKRARRRAVVIKCGVAAGPLCAVMYGTVRYAQSVIAHAPVTIVDQGILSENHKTQLAQELTHAIHEQGPAQVVAHCDRYSPLLSSVAVRYKIPLHGMVQYTTHTPIASLNGVTTLLSDGHLASMDLFAPEYVSTFPQLKVPHAILADSFPASLFTKLVQALPDTVVQRFACDWHHEDLCYYHDQSHGACTLVYGGTEAPTEDDVRIYDATMHLCASDMKKKNLYIDLRFKNQVVVFSHGGL